jgi:hypothetical protein
MLKASKILLISTVVSLCLAIVVVAQNAPAADGRAGGRGGMRGMRCGGSAPTVRSVEVLADRQVTFRISAPQATNIRFTSSDIFNLGPKSR